MSHLDLVAAFRLEFESIVWKKAWAHWSSPSIETDRILKKIPCWLCPKYPQSNILMKTNLGPWELSKISKQKATQVCWKVRDSLSRPTSQIWYFWNKTCAHSSSHSHKLINQILLNLLLKQNLGPLELSKFSSHMYLKLDLATCLTFDPFSETKNRPFRARQVKNWATYILLPAFGFTKHPSPSS